MAMYSWGGQPGFPPLFTIFEITSFDPVQGYTLVAPGLSDIGNMQLSLSPNVISEVQFNQPFPPHINGWTPQPPTTTPTTNTGLGEPTPGSWCQHARTLTIALILLSSAIAGGAAYLH